MKKVIRTRIPSALKLLRRTSGKLSGVACLPVILWRRAGAWRLTPTIRTVPERAGTPGTTTGRKLEAQRTRRARRNPTRTPGTTAAGRPARTHLVSLVVLRLMLRMSL